MLAEEAGAITAFGKKTSALPLERANEHMCQFNPSKLTFASRRRITRRSRGTASVEAAIALPVFFILLIGVEFISRQITARHGAESRARACSWQFSAVACDVEALTKCVDYVAEHL